MKSEKPKNSTKSIILYVPSYFHGFREIIEENLEQMGFEVYSIKDAPHKYKLRGVLKPLIRVLRRVFLRDRNYKNYLNEIRLEKLITEQLRMVEVADFALIFRPDELSIKSLMEISGKTVSMYAYQWDGFPRFPRIYERLKLFKKVYCVDVNDVGTESNVFSEKNFYFEINSTVCPRTPGKLCSTAYYIGTYDKERADSLRQIATQLRQLKIKTEINILGCPIIMHSWANRLDKARQYLDVIKDVKSSDILIDVDLRDMHEVLTFRVFEAIGYQKKLITTNVLIKNCDFYHPSNIFLFNGSIDELNDFLAKPMATLPLDLLKKYSFTEWVNRVLEIN